MTCGTILTCINTLVWRIWRSHIWGCHMMKIHYRHIFCREISHKYFLYTTESWLRCKHRRFAVRPAKITNANTRIDQELRITWKKSITATKSLRIRNSKIWNRKFDNLLEGNINKRYRMGNEIFVKSEITFCVQQYFLWIQIYNRTIEFPW